MLDINLKDKVTDTVAKLLFAQYGDIRVKMPMCNCASAGTPCEEPTNTKCISGQDPAGGVYTKLDQNGILEDSDGNEIPMTELLITCTSLEVIFFEMGNKIDALNGEIIVAPAPIPSKEKDLIILELFYDELYGYING